MMVCKQVTVVRAVNVFVSLIIEFIGFVQLRSW